LQTRTEPVTICDVEMRALSFSYQIVAGYPHLMPICEIMLLGPKGRIPLRALADSGATPSS
jgi:hypothetical protein